ncbi:hypothetical protein Tco_0080215 [Tanacetum coccineum]
MAAYSNKFKCVLQFNTFEERVIMYNDMTYSLLLESIVKRFNLDPNARFNLSFNLPAIERDITNDEDVEFFIDCATNYINDEIPYLYVRPPKVEARIKPGPAGPWLSAIMYLYGQGVSVSGCLGDMKKYCIKGKLELVVGVVKSCTPNSLGDMTVTLKDPTDIIMSDSEHSTITYLTELEYSDMGSPGVDGPPSPDYIPGPEAPPSPDYVPGPEAPPSPIYIPYVPEPEYPEFMPPEDHVFPAEEQPLPAVVSPTADSPGYIPESDPEGDPEEEDEEDPEEDPAYYPADIGDDDEEDEEEEHLASADSTVVALPAVDRTDSIFFISYSPFPQTPSPPPPQILSPPISPTRIEIPESCLPPRKRPRLASPTPIYEVGETSAAGAARHDVPAIPRDTLML